MNIYTVRDNLKKTIAGKELLLAQYRKALDGDGVLYEQKIAISAAAKFLEINISELDSILADVEVCCEQATAASWVGVDRQGGI